MRAFDAIATKAKQRPARIALPEGTDPRIIAAAIQAKTDGTAEPLLIGSRTSIEAAAEEQGLDISPVQSIDLATCDTADYLANELFEARKHKGMTAVNAAEALQDNLTFACMLVRCGKTDACVAGSVYPTADVVRTAMQLVGKSADANFVSSFFCMVGADISASSENTATAKTDQRHKADDTLVFADCALVIEPSEQELAEIAIQTGKSTKALLGVNPRIAMLSFSTAGSAKHAAVEKVQNATKLAQELARTAHPDWAIIGDVQLDAAIVPEILQQKSPSMAGVLADIPDSPKTCNIFIFPSLDAGNIGYKMCERFGARDAIGPVLQGLAKPVNDLSRGCKTDDIVNILAITSVQATQDY